MPSATAAVSEETDTAALDASEPKAPRRRRSPRKKAAEAAESPATDAADDGFGSGLAEEPEKKKPARRKPTRRNTAKADAESDDSDDDADRPAAKKRAARKSPAKKAAPKRTRKKKAEPEEIDLSEFDFGNDDDAPKPINPAAAAVVKPTRSVSFDDGGVRLPPSVAKNLRVEKLAETHDSSRQTGGGSGKKSRRGRRGKKGGDAPQPAPTPRGGGKPAPKQGGGQPVVGVLEMHPKGYGFLRDGSNNYVAQESDPFVSGALVDRFRLREGRHDRSARSAPATAARGRG